MKYGCFTREGRVIFAEPYSEFCQNIGLYLQFSSSAKKLETAYFESEELRAYWNCKVNDIGQLEDIETIRAENFDAIMHFHQEMAAIRTQGEKANRHMMEVHGQASIGSHYVECMTRIVQKVDSGSQLNDQEKSIWQMELDKHVSHMEPASICLMMQLQLDTWKRRKDTVLLSFLTQLKKCNVEF